LEAHVTDRLRHPHQDHLLVGATPWQFQL